MLHMKMKMNILGNVLIILQSTVVIIIQVQETSMQECAYSTFDCKEWQAIGHTKSGVYHVTPDWSHDGYDVYCDMETDGGGWLVFQRRINGSVDFYRNWTEYEDGFGDPSGDYWLGNIPLYLITSKYPYKLRIDLWDWEGNTAYAQYKWFKIGDGFKSYTLHVYEYSGTAGESLMYGNDKQFTTHDHDPTGSEGKEKKRSMVV